VTNLSIMRLIPSPPGRIVSGQVLFDGRDLLALDDEDMRAIRGRRIAMMHAVNQSGDRECTIEAILPGSPNGAANMITLQTLRRLTV